MLDELHFKISSALKDIIGRDLITDDYIAVFELVKNSYDAHASIVTVRFENIQSGEPRIIITDNGKGMSYDDLLNKWLFVAYSAKKEGTEDSNLDYRDYISGRRLFAGAKGIGRFSCDRLGKNLLLETTKAGNSRTEVLITEWEKFEDDLKDEFIAVPVLHETRENNTSTVEHGTTLIIENLRSGWDRNKLLRLKASLAKLINPTNQDSQFRLFLEAPEFENEDRNYDADHNKVNGEVKNFIFEALNLKTTKITTLISEDGQFIDTQLIDGGTIIYSIRETNKYSLLSNIRFTVYYLNMSAKLTFTRRMGLPSTKFGHIFLYKNGFRVYPYGEPGEDPLKIDARKAQGQRRYLGTRELIGQIEITSNSDEFKETSSRGDGLIKSNSYFEMEEAFWLTLRRLEKYVVDVQQWGFSIEDESNGNFQERVTDLISKLSGSDRIIEFSYAENLIDILNQSQSNSADRIVANLSRIASQSGNLELANEVNRINDKLNEIRLAKDEAENEVAVEKEKSTKAVKELKERESENLFLKSVKSQDLDEIVSFIHHIGISSSIVDNYLTGLHSQISDEDFNIEEAKDIIRLLIFENKKILNISRFATKANFRLTTDSIELDIVNYLSEYLKNIIQLSNNEHTKISFEDQINKPVIRKFKPIELNILIDNLLSNSKKAEATFFDIKLKLNDKAQIILEVEDDGVGIPDDNIDKIFNFGFTTLGGGSGIGLHHVKDIVKNIGGSINVYSKINVGTTFIINLN